MTLPAWLLRGSTVALALSLALAGCGPSEDDEDEDEVCTDPDPGIEVPPDYAPVIDPAAFGGPIDNPFMPLVPGTVLVYQGTDEDGATIDEEFAVTQETKAILGVACVVVRDQVRVDGELAEDTLDWFAQDSDGNVWYFGEDSKDYEDGVLVSTEGSWEAGVDGALPGIVMLAEPAVGDTYRQEYLVGEAEDRAEVLEIDQAVTVPFGAFEGVLVTKEWTPLEPCVVEHKFYAPGVGLVREQAVRGGSEELALVEVTGP